MRPLRNGFTLMEMMLVSVLICVVSMAVFQALNNGIKLFKRGLAIESQGQLMIALEKMSREMSSALVLEKIPFKATAQKIVFACMVRLQADPKSSRAHEGMVETIGAVEYRFDPAQGKIFRRVADYGQALKKQWGQEQEIAAGIEESDFEYIINSSKGSRQTHEVTVGLPSYIKISWKLKGPLHTQLLRYVPVILSGDAP